MDDSDTEMKNRIEGCVVGGAIGDALGYQCEFTRGIKEREYTTFKDDYGIFSDDTQMMLYTINGLLWGTTRHTIRGIAPKVPVCVLLAYRDWYFTQQGTPPDKGAVSVSWINKIPAMCHRRAPGFTCLNALASFDGENIPSIDKPINQSKGCGSTMRVAPIGFIHSSMTDIVKWGAETAALTHGHPLGIIPSAFVAGLIHEILYDTKHSLSEQLHIAFEYTNQFATKHFHRQYQQDFTNIMRKAFELSRNNRRDIDNISQIGEGWVAEEAVAIAVYCCLRHQDDFADAVIASVNHDGDSDSTGIIAGNIMGAHLGIEAIPSYYVDHIEQKELLFELADDFVNGPPFNSLDRPDGNSPWMIKYYYNKPAKEYQ